jgi:tetratricopeptide (TPR) repeat protein
MSAPGSGAPAPSPFASDNDVLDAATREFFEAEEALRQEHAAFDDGARPRASEDGGGSLHPAAEDGDGGNDGGAGGGEEGGQGEDEDGASSFSSSSADPSSSPPASRPLDAAKEEADGASLPEERRDAALAAACKDEGNRHFAAGEYDTASACYTEAIRHCPRSHEHDERRAVFYCNRAACAVSAGRADDAVYDCDRALELRPDYVKAVVRRAAMLEKLGQLDEALRGAFGVGGGEKGGRGEGSAY